MGVVVPEGRLGYREKYRLVQEYSRRVRKLHTDLKDYVGSQRAWFGTSKPTLGYKQDITLTFTTTQWRPNLGAIILPGCHGKSTFAKKYGFIDIDDLLSADETNMLNVKRIEMIEQRRMEWSDHNRLWFDMLNSKLDLMPLDKPTVVLCHTEECAIAIGAKPMGAVVLSGEPFEHGLIKSGRDYISKCFSRVNREVVVNKTGTCQLHTATSYSHIEHLVLAMCNASHVPVGAPFRYSRKYWNDNYSELTPDWILTGDCRELDWEELFELYDAGYIPKESVDYFVVAAGSVPVIDGFGVTMWDWARWVGDMGGSANTWQEVDHDADFWDLFPPQSKRETSNQNVSLKRLDSLYRIREDPNLAYILGHHLGEREIFVTNVVSVWAGLLRSLDCGLDTIQWMRVSESRWRSVFKKLHNMVRLSKTIFHREVSELDRQKLMYLENAVGKFEYTIDEQSVVDERAEDMLPNHVAYDPVSQRWTHGQYEEDFDNVLSGAYSHLATEPIKVSYASFKEFWKIRKTWATQGSLVYNNLPSDMKKYSIFIDRVGDSMAKHIEVVGRHKKGSLLEEHDILELFNVSVREFNTTKMALKYETAKERALLPGSLVHFIVFSYILHVAEHYSRIGCSRLNGPSDEDPGYIEAKMAGGVHLLYDWANFNAQHTSPDMAKVVYALGQRIKVNTDYWLFCNAIAESMFEMWLQKSDKTIVKLDGGLYSGWRGTTWINTVLNVVYTGCAWLSYRRLYDDAVILHSDQGGDDVDTTLGTIDCAIKFYQVMGRMGHSATLIKQGFQRRSEFYRITIANGVVYGSPTRALFNFTTGSWESEIQTGNANRVHSILEQISKLKRRGLDSDFGDGLMAIAVMHWAKFKSDDQWKQLPPCVVHGRSEDGGLGVPDRFGKVWRLEHDISTSRSKVIATLPGVKSSSDYIDELAHEIESKGGQLVGRDGLIQQLAQASYDVVAAFDNLEWEQLFETDVGVIGYEDCVHGEVDDDLVHAFFNWSNGAQCKEMDKYRDLTHLLGCVEIGGRVASLEEIQTLFGATVIPAEACLFRGSRYNRWLIPEYLAVQVEKYTRYRMWQYGENGDVTFNNLTVSLASRLVSHN